METSSNISLKLIEIQESVLPEDEWLIGISSLDYFNGVGYSMPSGVRFDEMIFEQDGLLMGGTLSGDLVKSSNVGDALRFVKQDFGTDDPLLSGKYIHDDDALRATGIEDSEGVGLNVESEGYLLTNLDENYEPQNLYAFIPGIFYCSAQETSVDGVLIEVTQTQRFGMTLSSFRPEDVRPLDLSQGMMLDENGFGRSIQLTVETLGSFHAESFIKDSGIMESDIQYCREIELANRLTQWLTLPILKQAYAASSFLQNRLMKLLDDVEFFGIQPRRRLYIRNEKHPYGSIIETKYHGYDNILDLSHQTGITCPDEIDLEMQLRRLTFSKMLGIGTETNIEGAVMDLFTLISKELDGKTSKDEILSYFTGRSSI